MYCRLHCFLKYIKTYVPTNHSSLAFYVDTMYRGYDHLLFIYILVYIVWCPTAFQEYLRIKLPPTMSWPSLSH